MAKGIEVLKIDQHKKEAVVAISLTWLSKILSTEATRCSAENDVQQQNLETLEGIFRKDDQSTAAELLNVLRGKILKKNGKTAGKQKTKEFIEQCTGAYPPLLFQYNGKGNTRLFRLNHDELNNIRAANKNLDTVPDEKIMEVIEDKMVLVYEIKLPEDLKTWLTQTPMPSDAEIFEKCRKYIAEYIISTDRQENSNK